MLVCWTEREEVANDKADSKVKGKDRAEKKTDKKADDSGSEKEIVKEWRTRSRGLEKGAVMFLIDWLT